MRTIAIRHRAVIGLSAVALITVGCSNGTSVDVPSPEVGLIATTSSAAPAQPAEVKLIGERDVEVTLTGDHNAGTRESGAVFQQFQGGAIIAKNNQAGTPAFIVVGKIRDAWNIQRDADGTPSITGNNGSAGPLGLPTSDENTEGDQLVSTFEHGKIEYNAKSGEVAVTVNGKVVPSGL